MTDVTVARRRLAALEEVEEILKREWGETEGGIFALYTDRMSVNVRPHEPEPPIPGHEDECWLNVCGIYKAVKELRADMESMAEHAERFQMQHGPLRSWVVKPEQ